ncbi:nicolin-1-like, partial [Convolutriloba macropyga]|uniref:nicolin-1-like n=1 Tax=Convolutriloba macropyga TaxID=536237 RepID=UPI003F528CDD
MPPNQCSLSWFVKKPVYLSAFDSELSHSGVALIDIMFHTVSSFPFSQLSFKNNYTAFITIKVKCKDVPVVSNVKSQQTQNSTSTGGSMNTSSKPNQKWRTVLRNFALMPCPNSEEGSQKTFVIT